MSEVVWHRPGRGDIVRPPRLPQPRENAEVTTSHPRGLTALIPITATTTAGERAAAQLLHLRTAAVPVPVVAAAAELIAAHLDHPDPVTREAATTVHNHLLAALKEAHPGR